MVQASFVTVEEGEGRVSARQRSKAMGDSAAIVVPRLVDIFATLFHLDFQQAGFNVGVADQAPVRGGELPDEIRLGLVGGSEVVEISLDSASNCSSDSLGRTTVSAVRPCFTALSETARRPSSVLGPQDLDPPKDWIHLMRAVSALVRMLVPGESVAGGVGR